MTKLFEVQVTINGVINDVRVHQTGDDVKFQFNVDTVLGLTRKGKLLRFISITTTGVKLDKWGKFAKSDITRLFRNEVERKQHQAKLGSHDINLQVASYDNGMLSVSIDNDIVFHIDEYGIYRYSCRQNKALSLNKRDKMKWEEP